MSIQGAFTQYAGSGNSSSTNTPAAAYGQLYRALNDDPTTAQSLPYASDITKAN